MCLQKKVAAWKGAHIEKVIEIGRRGVRVKVAQTVDTL